MFGVWVGKDTFFQICEDCILCLENGKLTKQWYGKTKFVPEEEITITNTIKKKESLPNGIFCASQYCTDE